MILEILCIITIFIGDQCRQVTGKEPTRGGVVYDRYHGEANNASDIPPDGYIAYGRQASIGEFPWMSFILTKNKNDGKTYQCGGSLISDRHVITAAHCVTEVRYLQDVTIIVGEYNTDSFPTDCVNNRCTQNLRTQAAQVTWHERYDPSTTSNDIAIVRLQDVVKSDYIRPISLPPFDVDNTIYENAPLTVAGWGKTENSRTSEILLATEINLKTRRQCYRIYNYAYPKGHLCAGTLEYRNSCGGDSGGPLMMYYGNKFYLSGLVSFSWSSRCGVSKANYYTNVFKYLKWIRWAMRQ